MAEASVPVSAPAPTVTSSAGASVTTAPAARTRQPGLLSRLLALVGASPSLAANTGSADGLTDSELRYRLFEALRATEPGFPTYSWGDGSLPGIVDIIQSTSTVIYCTRPEDDYLYFWQTFTVAADGTVTLNGDRQRVEYDWVPLSPAEVAAEDAEDDDDMGGAVMTMAAPTPAAPSAAATASPPPCGCGRTLAATASAAAATPVPAPSSPQTPTAASGEGDPSTVATATPPSPTPVQTLAARLVACGKFTAAEAPTLESMGEAALTALCEKFAPAAAPTTAPATAPAATPVVTPSANATPAAPATLDDWIVTAHPEAVAMFNRVREMDARQQAAEATHRKSITAAILTAQRSTVYTAEKLAKLSMSDLLDVAAVVGVSANTGSLAPLAPSYLGLGLPTRPDVDPNAADAAADTYDWVDGYTLSAMERGKPLPLGGTASASTNAVAKPPVTN